MYVLLHWCLVPVVSQWQGTLKSSLISLFSKRFIALSSRGPPFINKSHVFKDKLTCFQANWPIAARYFYIVLRALIQWSRSFPTVTKSVFKQLTRLINANEDLIILLTVHLIFVLWIFTIKLHFGGIRPNQYVSKSFRSIKLITAANQFCVNSSFIGPTIKRLIQHLVEWNAPWALHY